ncbi:dephospho-CoA kinase [Liquorilactobacillus nagelii]
MFEEKYKLPIIDADKIAREVVEPGNKAYDQIIKHFNNLLICGLINCI